MIQNHVSEKVNFISLMRSMLAYQLHVFIGQDWLFQSDDI